MSATRLEALEAKRIATDRWLSDPDVSAIGIVLINPADPNAGFAVVIYLKTRLDETATRRFGKFIEASIEGRRTGYFLPPQRTGAHAALR